MLAAGCKTVISIDTFQGTKGEVTEIWHREAMLGGYLGRLEGQRAFPFVGKSEDLAPFIPDGIADLVFIDADHTYEAVKQDIMLWKPKLKPGGLLSGHDYDKKHPDVKRAVDDTVVPVDFCHGRIWGKRV